MKKKINLSGLEELLGSARKKQKTTRALAAVLSVLSVLVTLHILIVPAITLESEFKCGLEEHLHSEDCYAPDGDFICEKTEHQHSDECLEKDDETSEGTEGESVGETQTECAESEETVEEDIPEDIFLETPAAEPEAPEGDVTLFYETKSGIAVTVTGPAASFPIEREYLGLKVDEISEETEDFDALEKYDELSEDYRKEGLNAGSVYMFEIKLLYEGEEIEPTGPVRVSFDGLSDKIDSIVHLGENENERIPIEKSKDREVIFSTTHFSVYGLVSLRGDETPKEQTETSLTVKKNWSDTWNSHSPVTVKLMRRDAEGQAHETGRTLTLSDENNWEATFDGIELPAEGESFTYFIEENPVEGYIAQYEEIKKTEPIDGDIWVPVPGNQMTNGGTYAFCTRYGNGYYLMNRGNGNNLGAVSAERRGTLEVGGNVYSSYLTNVPESAVFDASSYGNGFALSSALDGMYLRGNQFTQAINNSTPYICTNGKMSCSSGYLYLTYHFGGAGFNMTNYQQWASDFQLYERLVQPQEESYTTTVRNIRIYPSQGIIDPDPQLHKEIDYLGDGGENEDTTLSGDDFYRLYLDVTGSHQPVDLLIVADISNSMANDFGGGMSRQAALDKIVNGTIISGSGANAVRDNDGIIYNFLNMHHENNVAVTCFNGGWNEVNNATYEGTKDYHNPITMPWTSLSEMPNGGAEPRDCYARVTRNNEPGGTNYTSALLRSEELLSDPEIANNNHIKVMIFLTDGEPNRIIDENGVIRDENAPHTYTENKFVEFVAAHPNMVPYIVGISPDANSGEAYNTLSSIADRAHLTYYPANDARYLQTVLQTIIDRSKFSLVQITDELSSYVEYYSEQPDVKVTRTDSEGNQTVVWDSSGPTEYNFDPNGNSIVQSVTFRESEDGSSTGKVNVTFNPQCLLDGENTFVLSFNVKVTDYAKTQFAAEGYNAEGDEGTDFGNNETSSSQAGFYSNKDAYITFTAYDVGHKTSYDHPVVQVGAVLLKLVKVSAANETPLAGAGFDIYKAAESTQEGAVIIPGLSQEYGVKINETTIVTGDGGMSVPTVLAPGKYYLVETQAPDGYYPTGKPVVFNISPGGITVLELENYSANGHAGEIDEDGTFSIVIDNNISHQLPNTGGSGVEIYTWSGLLIIAGALALSFKKKTIQK